MIKKHLGDDYVKLAGETELIRLVEDTNSDGKADSSKVFADGFVGQDLGSSAAQSVILLVVVGLLTVLQFRYVEKKVHY